MTGFASSGASGAQAVASISSPSWNSFDIGPLTLNIYGLAIATGVLVALWFARYRYAKAGGDPDLMDRVAIWVILAGIVGARIGFVIPRLDQFAEEPLKAFQIWEGGLTFFGALAGGGLVGGIILYRNNVRMGLFLTAVAPVIPLAQAIGRWGNYFNQELYGKPTDLPWGLEIDPENRVPGYALADGYGVDATFHPTFLYEMLWNLALVAVLLLVERKVRLKAGSLFGVYLIGYGIGRFVMELLRIDTETRILGLSRNAYNSLLIVASGAVGVWLWERHADVLKALGRKSVGRFVKPADEAAEADDEGEEADAAAAGDAEDAAAPDEAEPADDALAEEDADEAVAEEDATDADDGDEGEADEADDTEAVDSDDDSDSGEGDGEPADDAVAEDDADETV